MRYCNAPFTKSCWALAAVEANNRGLHVCLVQPRGTSGPAIPVSRAPSLGRASGGNKPCGLPGPKLAVLPVCALPPSLPPSAIVYFVPYSTLLLFAQALPAKLC